MTAGIDRRTGRPREGWPHVAQSLAVIFSTGFGDRVLRRTFGSAVPRLLGKNLTPETMLRFFVAVAIAIEMWEPRFRVRAFGYTGATTGATLGQGRLGVTVDGDYVPGALEGDLTVAIPRSYVF